MKCRFGAFELDTETEELRRNGRTVRLQPQPYKLLHLLTSRAGRLVTRDEIRAALWTAETYVDYEQGVNFAMKQVRDALKETADHPIYIETVPKRGYRFIAPVETLDAANAIGIARLAGDGSDLNLQKVLWANIAELRIAESRRARRRELVKKVAVYVAITVAVIAIAVALRAVWR